MKSTKAKYFLERNMGMDKDGRDYNPKLISDYMDWDLQHFVRDPCIDMRSYCYEDYQSPYPSHSSTTNTQL